MCREIKGWTQTVVRTKRCSQREPNRDRCVQTEKRKKNNNKNMEMDKVWPNQILKDSHWDKERAFCQAAATVNLWEVLDSETYQLVLLHSLWDELYCSSPMPSENCKPLHKTFSLWFCQVEISLFNIVVFDKVCMYFQFITHSLLRVPLTATVCCQFPTPAIHTEF